MKIAISSSGKDLNSAIDPRFGRCAFFVFAETEDMTFESFDNENIALRGGAGIQSAQFVASKGAKAVITGSCGPNAVRTLNAAGVKVIVGQTGNVREAIERFKNGMLDATTEANVSDHHGAQVTNPTRSDYNGSRNTMGAEMGTGRGRGLGRGMRCGKGRGMGGGRGEIGGTPMPPAQAAPSNKDQEITFLRNQTSDLRNQVEALEAEIRSLQKQ